MNIPYAKVEYLLELPKKIIVNDSIQDNLTIWQKSPFNARFKLISEKDEEYTFLWEINQSEKKSIRISFHFQENDSETGLIRIDYNGSHQNPRIKSPSLPEKFHPFVGKHFEDKNHIHYYVQGYRHLAWAIPLTKSDFKIKELHDDSEFNNTFVEIIKLFAKTVNIQTKITVNQVLL